MPALPGESPENLQILIFPLPYYHAQILLPQFRLLVISNDALRHVEFEADTHFMGKVLTDGGMASVGVHAIELAVDTQVVVLWCVRMQVPGGEVIVTVAMENIRVFLTTFSVIDDCRILDPGVG